PQDGNAPASTWVKMVPRGGAVSPSPLSFPQHSASPSVRPPHAWRDPTLTDANAVSLGGVSAAVQMTPSGKRGRRASSAGGRAPRRANARREHPLRSSQSAFSRSPRSFTNTKRNGYG